MNPNDAPSGENDADRTSESDNVVLVVIDGPGDRTIRKRPADRPLSPPGRPPLPLPPQSRNGPSQDAQRP
jgi:hypothetical protein